MNYFFLLLTLCVVCVLLRRDVIAAENCALYDGFTDSICLSGNSIDQQLKGSPTAWVVEFYSSWCGHCQHFSPTWKKIATKVKRWSKVIRIGQIDCTNSINRDICSSYHISAFPTFKLFNVHEGDPRSKGIRHFVGARNMGVVMKEIMDHINQQGLVPSLVPLASSNVSKIDVLIFEEDSSYVGIEIILEFINKPIIIRRSHNNKELIRHYSILQIPSMVLKPHSSTTYSIIGPPSASQLTNQDIVEHFKESIRELSHNNVILSSSVPPVNTDTIQIPDTNITPSMRVTMDDLLSAISYALRYEVALHKIIQGDSLFVLSQFIEYLEKAFTFVNETISTELKEVRTRLELRESRGFITNSDWNIILRRKLDPHLFPTEPKWVKCLGSKPYLRGYPCGLWVLMHTTTIISLSRPHSTSSSSTTSSREALYTMTKFILNFFSCSECAAHFSKLVLNLKEHPLSYDGDSILWLWEAHNIVNYRLRDCTTSCDPLHPKVLFPSIRMCPYCYMKSTDDNSKLSYSLIKSHSIPLTVNHINYTWNRTAVYLFLCSYYGLGQFDHINQQDLVHYGWPRHYPYDSNQDFMSRLHLRLTTTTKSKLKPFIYLVVVVFVIVFILLFKNKLIRRYRHKLL